MAYGVKRGLREPGAFSAIDIIGLAGAAAFGIISALLTDFQQKGEASALFTVNQWVATVGSFVGVDRPPMWTIIAGLIAMGAGSIFYFQPITRQGAFAHGFGLLAIIMTAVPSDLAGGLYGLDAPALTRVGLVEDPADRAKIVAGADGDAPTVAATARIEVADVEVSADDVPSQVDGAPAYNVRLRIDAPEGLPDDLAMAIKRGMLRGRLHNAETGRTYNLFRNAGGALERVGDSIFISAGVPAVGESAELWVRIELNGYAIEEQSATARLDGQLDWRIVLRPSSTPMLIQRIQKSYWF